MSSKRENTRGGRLGSTESFDDRQTGQMTMIPGKVSVYADVARSAREMFALRRREPSETLVDDKLCKWTGRERSSSLAMGTPCPLQEDRAAIGGQPKVVFREPRDKLSSRRESIVIAN